MELKDIVYYTVEFLYTFNPSGIPPHNLCLKMEAPIMLLRNFIPPKFCNGTRLHITFIFTRCKMGKAVFLPKISLIPSGYHFQFKRLQFSVNVCYAMTINKAQGHFLKVSEVDLKNDCFFHTQLYVACSRISSSDS